MGVEGDSGKILNFVPSGDFHVFRKEKDRHSRFVVHSFRDFYFIFGTNADSVKKVIVIIPITKEQKKIFEDLSGNYRTSTPYDYAFFGMRCGAATYDILAQLGIMKKYTVRRTYKKIFYPQKLRKRLFRLADKKQMDNHQGNGNGEEEMGKVI